MATRSPYEGFRFESVEQQPTSGPPPLRPPVPVAREIAAGRRTAARPGGVAHRVERAGGAAVIAQIQILSSESDCRKGDGAEADRASDESAFAKKLRLHLEAQAGRPHPQRPHGDPKGQPSLLTRRANRA